MSKKEKVYDVRIALPEDEQEEDYTETSYLFCWEPDYEWAIINGDQVISQSPSIKVIVEYPLDRPAEFIYRNYGRPWTLKDITERFIKAYHRVYRNADMGDNRYGVWGHNLGDLTIDCVYSSDGITFRSGNSS